MTVVYVLTRHDNGLAMCGEPQTFATMDLAIETAREQACERAADARLVFEHDDDYLSSVSANAFGIVYVITQCALIGAPGNEETS